MANEGAAIGSLSTPAVTEADLRSFHALHYGNATAPVALFVSNHDLQYEEDDVLGYYPDGTKRTLTDDQIAMFRHTEVQTLLRERQLAQDSSDADKRMRGHGASLSEEDTRNTAAVKSSKPTKQSKQSPVHESSDQTKRKWDHFIDDTEENTDFRTHRRMARELDELQQDSVDLAYGEEDVLAPSSKKPKSDIWSKPVPSRFEWPALGPESSAPAVS